MPPLPNSNSAPYPHPQQNNVQFGAGGGAFPYSNQTNPYPTQQSYPGYPSAQTQNSNPGYPTQQYHNVTAPTQPHIPFGAGFMPPQTYPNQSAYPPSSTTTSYPPTQNPYPQNSQNAYPHINQPSGYSGYGFQQASSSSAPFSNPIVSNMACFSEMQGHIRDVRKSKVGFDFISFLDFFVFFCAIDEQKYERTQIP